MEDRRKINQQHKHKDKQRNAKPTGKNNTTTQPATSTRISFQDDESTDPHFSKRTLTSNWGKYELAPLDAEEEYQQLSAADFEMLLLAPKSVGSHFVFSNEKSWSTDTDEGVVDQTLLGGHHFRFNLVEFEQQMATIPFYQRQDYGVDLFSDKEIEEMDRCAKLAPRPDAMKTSDVPNEVHEDALKLLAVLKGDANNEGRVDPVVTERLVNSSALKVEDNIVADELDALLDLANTVPVAVAATIPFASVNVPAGPATTSGVAPADDIQKWLDDILDD